MKFSLDRDIFAKTLKRIDGVCSNRGSFSILSTCFIEARNNSIIVTGTDLDITLRIVEDATVIEEGVFVINAKRLLDTVQNQIPGNINVTSEGAQVQIEAGNFRANLNCGDIKEYPHINIEQAHPITMSAQVLKLLIDKTMFSISKDDSRAEFTGALLTISQNGCIQMVSTDGHRLSRAEDHINVSGALSQSFEKGIIIPRKGLAELTKIVDGDISLDVNNGKLTVYANSTTLHINLIAGFFPDFTKVIPSQLDHKAIVHRENLQQAIKRASVFAANAGTIKLTMSMGKLDISSMNANSGEMRDFIEADYDGSGVVAGFNWKYIDEILSVIDSDYVSLEIIDMDSPAVIRDTKSDKYDFLVMSMQI